MRCGVVVWGGAGRWVCVVCALGVRWVCAGCALGVRWVCVGCALGVCWVCVGRVLVCLVALGGVWSGPVEFG